MTSLTKTLFFLCLFIFFSTLTANETQKDSVDTYLNTMQTLVKNKDRFKEDFFDTHFLLTQKNKTEGKENVIILLKLYTAYLYSSAELAINYNEQALHLSEKIGYKEGSLQAQYNDAYFLFVKGKFDTSMDKALEIEKQVSSTLFPEIYGDITTLKSDIYTEWGEYDKALETGLTLLDKAEKNSNDYLLMKANAALSHYYLRIENYSKSLSYCLKGLHYILKLRKTEYFYRKLDEIAKMTANLGDPEEALKVYALFFEIEKKYAPAGNYILASVHNNIANIYMSIGSLEKALNHIAKALKINYENNYRFRIPRALTVQAALFLKTKDTIKAISNYEMSIEAAENINAFDVVKRNSFILGELYEKTNQLTKSQDYKALYRVINDSLFSNEKEQKIIILETKRKITEILQKKKILELENVSQKAQFKGIIIILILLITISCISIFAYLKVRNKNRLLLQRTIDLAKMQLKINEEPKIQSTKNQRPNKIKNAVIAKTQPRIDNDIKNIILIKLERLEKEKFFLDPQCSLHQLSDQLKTNPKYLSQVINQEKKLNFNNYINELRINYLLPKLLKDVSFRNSKLSYLAVSIGYNNLNTFNTAFKKRLGILPSKFINELNTSYEIKKSSSKPSYKINKISIEV